MRAKIKDEYTGSATCTTQGAEKASDGEVA